MYYVVVFSRDGKKFSIYTSKEIENVPGTASRYSKVYLSKLLFTNFKSGKYSGEGYTDFLQNKFLFTDLNLAMHAVVKRFMK